MSKKQHQIDILANFIMGHVEGEPSRCEGAGDCAIRIINQLQAELAEKDKALEWIAEFASCEFNCDDCETDVRCAKRMAEQALKGE